jgi:hypothetical protein
VLKIKVILIIIKMPGKEIIIKCMAYASFFAAGSLLLLYTFQDKMLYMPGAPIRHIIDNPRGYRSPDERKI